MSVFSVFTDVSIGFDAVSHGILLTKVEYYEIRSNALNLLAEFNQQNDLYQGT